MASNQELKSSDGNSWDEKNSSKPHHVCDEITGSSFIHILDQLFIYPYFRPTLHLLEKIRTRDHITIELAH